MRRVVTTLFVIGLVVATPSVAVSAGSQSSKAEKAELKQRHTPEKPAHASVPPGAYRDRLHVKFAEGTLIRQRGNKFVSEGDDDLSGLDAVMRDHHGVKIDRLFDRPENVLEAEKAAVERRSGREQADFNLYYRLRLHKSDDAVTFIDDLHGLDVVEIAYAEPKPVPVPASPDYEPNQTYRGAATNGIDVAAAEDVPGGRGQNVRIIDIEYSWNTNHEDLSKARAAGATINNGTPSDPFSSNDHGTAVLGEMVADDNGEGVTGLAPDATVGMVNANNTEDGYDLADAINTAAGALTAGDVILLEQQTAGTSACNNGTSGCVAVEYVQAFYDAIVAATSAGIIVVEAAGNGNEDLDGSGYNSTFGTRADSGAIIVGSANNTGCTSPTHGRITSSTYGARVNLHAFGECVATTGYGGLQGSSMSNDAYTGGFSGTSSASPIVTSAAAIMSSVAQSQGDANGLTSTEVRALLASGGTAQDTSATANTGNIGPMPNLASAMAAYRPNAVLPSVSTPEGTDVGLNASGSTDPQGGALTYAWDLDNDGAYDDGSGATINYTAVGQDGVYPVGVRVTDPGGATDTATANVTVTNVAPSITPSSVGPSDEGSLVSLTAGASDPGWLEALSVTVDWGDGSGATPASGTVENNRPDATTNVSSSHRYADNGNYTINVCAQDDDTATCVPLSISVSNVKPAVNAPTSSATVDEGDTVPVLAEFSDPGWADTYAATIDWGTGETESAPVTMTAQGPLLDQGNVSGSHGYGDNGSFTIMTTVADDDGGSGSAPVQVTVLNVAPATTINLAGTTSINGTPTVMSNAGQSVPFSARTTDKGSDDLTLTWTWGDGQTVSTFSAVNPPALDPFPSPSVQPRDVTDNKSHAFGQACKYTVVFDAKDDDAGAHASSVNVIITGNAVKNRSAGFWKQQYDGSGKNFTAAQRNCFLAIAGYVSRVFDELRDASTMAKALAVLNTGNGTTTRQQYDRQLLAALLNFANGSTDWTQLVDTNGDKKVDMTFAQMLTNAENVRTANPINNAALERQMKILERINLRDGG